MNNNISNLFEEYEILKGSLMTIVPFDAYPARELVQQIRSKIPVTLKSVLSVSDVMNTDDYGGLICTIELDKQTLACSLTHLIIPTDNPFYKEITAYQIKRIKRLQKQKQNQNKFR